MSPGSIVVLSFMIVSVISYPQASVNDHTLFDMNSSDNLFASSAIGLDSSNTFDNSLTLNEDYTTNIKTDPNVFETGDVSDVHLGLANDNSINTISEPLDLLTDQSDSSCEPVSRKRDDLSDALLGKFRHPRYPFLILQQRMTCPYR